MTGFPGILLCAGGSRRMGRPKPLLPWGGVPLVLAHVRAFEAAGLVVTVVTGALGEDVASAVPGVHRVHNPRWDETHPSDSLRLALREVDVRAGVLVSPVDVRPASRDVLTALVGGDTSAVPVGTDGREGHPVWLGPQDAARARDEALPDGLRGLLVGALRVRVGERVGEDFDVPADWERVVGRPVVTAPAATGE